MLHCNKTSENGYKTLRKLGQQNVTRTIWYRCTKIVNFSVDWPLTIESWWPLTSLVNLRYKMVILLKCQVTPTLVDTVVAMTPKGFPSSLAQLFNNSRKFPGQTFAYEQRFSVSRVVGRITESLRLLSSLGNNTHTVVNITLLSIITKGKTLTYFTIDLYFWYQVIWNPVYKLMCPKTK